MIEISLSTHRGEIKRKKHQKIRYNLGGDIWCVFAGQTEKKARDYNNRIENLRIQKYNNNDFEDSCNFPNIPDCNQN